MAALDGEGDAQKLRFGPWLLNAVSSGLYRGLCWIDPTRRIFRIPWKHNARKDVTSSDVEIFKVGGRRGFERWVGWSTVGTVRRWRWRKRRAVFKMAGRGAKAAWGSAESAVLEVWKMWR
ncbi:hypothetical protein CIB84_015208 [Bambusicola thoracicus]|uniref:IRF tryptophan pentad repeat domain-containing protein n=1 Tax=Bambusicola thoracicus TaxID=9083 RepID=A0A2P4SAD9_BAMTH|nr:hypothetical protein CIB84_015208 [Bambusicola thoracicus]